MRELNAIFTIAYRDLLKLLRDRTRMLASLIFPVIFIGVLGGSLQSNLSDNLGYNFLTFTFIGVLAQTLFQSTASGIISLIEDRENDFSQEMFVSPISRYTILFGKIVGETLVSLTQVIGVLAFGFLIGIPLSIPTLLTLLPFGLLASLFGGAFGVIVLANLGSQRTANQIFPFIIFPQFFLAGVFNPIKNLYFPLNVLSYLAPMRYAVDLMRGIYYWGRPEYDKVVLLNPLTNLLIIGILLAVFMTVGTVMFVRNERNR
jgi:ABC-2 type transport system permease protein